MTAPPTSAPAGGPHAAGPGRPRAWRRLARAVWVLLAVLYAILILVNEARSPPQQEPFFTFANARLVLTQTVIVGLCTLGMTFVVASGGIDLSVGSNVALSSVVAALALRDGLAPGAALGVGVGAGAAVGLLNGLLVTRLRILPFIATLGTLGVARGAAKWLGEQEPVRVDPETVRGFAQLMQKKPDPEWLVFAPGVWLLLLLGVLMAFVLRRSVLGVRTLAIGSNEATASLCGVPVARTRVVLYALCGLFAGLAGAMQLARLTVGDPTTAAGLELDVIAAVVIGGGSLAGGEGSILGSLVGAFLMALLKNGCNLAGVANYAQEMLVGAIIVAAVGFDRLRHGRAS